MSLFKKEKLPGPQEQRTVLVRSPTFPKKERAWRRFAFEGLEQVSRTEAQLVERLGWLMPSIGAAGEVPKEALARLGQLFDEDVVLRMDSVHVVQAGELKRIVATPTVLGALSPSPRKTRGFLEVELSLAHAMVDLLLGGAGGVTGLRPLTEIEEGVLSFVLIEALKSLAPYIEPGLPRIRLEGMAHKRDAVVAGLAEEKHILLAQLKCIVGSRAGYLRLFIPGSILGLANPVVGGPERRARTALRARHHLGRLGAVGSWLRAELGTFELGSREFLQLAPKAVVALPEPLSFRPDKGEQGGASLRVGLGTKGALRARVELKDGRYQATVVEFVWGDEARAEPDAPEPSTGGEALEEPKSEGAALLGDIPLEIAVELGRVPVTAEEVVGLHVGQVIDLKRVPNEPVELSVRGKVVAKGELVEVEGQVGVRILSLVR